MSLRRKEESVMQDEGRKMCEEGEYIRQEAIMASRTSLPILMLLSVRRWFKMNWSLSLVHLTTMFTDVLLLCSCYEECKSKVAGALMERRA